MEPVLAKLETEAEVAERERARHELLTARWGDKPKPVPQKTPMVEAASQIWWHANEVFRMLRELEKRLEPVLALKPGVETIAKDDLPKLSAPLGVHLEGALMTLSHVEAALVDLQARLQL